MFEKRKGISTFIATLLLMVLAVSAGVVIYAYTMGYMGGFGGTDTLGAMSLDEASMVSAVATAPAVDDDGELNAYVRNIGKTTITISIAYIDGEQYALSSPVEIAEDTVELVTITEDDYAGSDSTDPAWAPGSYEVKLLADDNTQLSFSIKCK